MTRVGVREFRADMRKWLNKVAKGGEVIITDRGKAVAKVTSPYGRDKLDELVAAGLVIPPRKPFIAAGKIRKVRSKASVSDAVIEDRRR